MAVGCFGELFADFCADDPVVSVAEPVVFVHELSDSLFGLAVGQCGVDEVDVEVYCSLEECCELFV